MYKKKASEFFFPFWLWDFLKYAVLPWFTRQNPSRCFCFIKHSDLIFLSVSKTGLVICLQIKKDHKVTNSARRLPHTHICLLGEGTRAKKAALCIQSKLSPSVMAIKNSICAFNVFLWSNTGTNYNKTLSSNCLCMHSVSVVLWSKCPGSKWDKYVISKRITHFRVIWVLTGLCNMIKFRHTPVFWTGVVCCRFGVIDSLVTPYKASSVMLELPGVPYVFIIHYQQA